MGCNQSSERKGASSTPVVPPNETKQAAVADSPVRSVVSEEVPTEPITAPAETSVEAVTVTTSSSPIPAETVMTMHDEEPADRDQSIRDGHVVVSSIAPANNDENGQQPSTPAKARAVPVLTLQQKRTPNKQSKRGAHSARGTSRVTPRAALKENAPKAKTPSKPAASTPLRTFGLADTNTGSPTGAHKKVCFNAVPAQTDKATMNKNRARKAAGKHAGNVNEDIFLASIAAFERQLTHRATLEKHLNTR